MWLDLQLIKYLHIQKSCSCGPRPSHLKIPCESKLASAALRSRTFGRRDVWVPRACASEILGVGQSSMYNYAITGTRYFHQSNFHFKNHRLIWNKILTF